MSPLVAGTALLLGVGSIVHPQLSRTALQPRDQPGLWLSAPALRTRPRPAPADGAPPTSLAAALPGGPDPVPALDGPSADAQMQGLVLGAMRRLGDRLGARPVAHAASWLARSGLQLQIRPSSLGLSLSLRLP